MILITGATGFIGAYLVDEMIREGFDVLATGRNRAAELFYKEILVPFARLDITDRKNFDKLPKSNIDAVIHLSALLPANVIDYDPREYINVNIIGTINVLEYCRNNNIPKIISTTSYADVQNIWKKGEPINEKAHRNFKFKGDHAVYVISKNTANDLIEYYTEEYGIQNVIFRLPPVYGYGPHLEIYANGKYYKSGFQIFFEKAMKGEDIEIWGDNQITRDIVYIKDVLSAFILALKSNKAKGLYNISSGIPLSLDEQVKTTIKVFSPKGKKSKIIYYPNKKNNSSSYIFDIRKAKEDFEYDPKYIPFEKLLIDYKKEMKLKRFPFLIEGRKKIKNI